MVDNDLELALESALERLSAVESRSGENSIDIAGLKKVDDGQQAALGKIDEKLAADNEAIKTLNSSSISAQSASEAQAAAIETLTRRVLTLEERLNGTAYKGLKPRQTLEELQDQQDGINAAISGSRFGISLEDIASGARGVRGIVRGAQAIGVSTLLGIFGIVASSYFGWGKAVDLSGPFNQLVQRVEYIEGMAKETKDKLERMRDRELEKSK